MLKKLALGGVGLVLLALPLGTSAMDKCISADNYAICELQVQIANLQAQLAALIGQMKTSTSVTGDASRCLDLKNALIIGSTDARTNGEVSKLQCFLKANGYFPDAQCTGYYGEKTAVAVVRWQKAHGMDFVTTRSGVGPMTRGKMKCGNTGAPVITKVEWRIELA